MITQLVPRDQSAQPVPGPQVRIVRGDPTDAEVAALVTGLMAVATEEPRSGWPRPSGWADRSRALRTDLPHSTEAWRWSLRP